MVIDYLKNLNHYRYLISEIEEKVEFALSLKDTEVGRYEKEDYFVLVQEGETNIVENVKFEAHIKYIDIQILYSGRELVKWNTTDKLNVIEPYVYEKDICFYIGAGNSFVVEENMFYIMFPEDAHAPCLAVSDKEKYKKLVIKCRV